MIDRTCKNPKCRQLFQARTADVARGWGLFCCKSCKASTKPLANGARDYARLGIKPAATCVKRQPFARQESMYELGATELPKWDDTQWLAAG